MSDAVDAVVVGAGVVGLAIARSLASSGREVLVVERNGRIGEEASSRNSEVIHAGIYYPQSSLKARLCVRGRQLLYDYCEDRAVPHSRCGKLIVATDQGQIRELAALQDRAARNGVSDLSMLERKEAQVLEPELTCLAAIKSPSTGVLDSHGLMVALKSDLEAAGGAVLLGTEFLGARSDRTRLCVTIRERGSSVDLQTDAIVSSAGLAASRVAVLAGCPAKFVPKTRYAKGSYFVLTGASPFSRLVYPMPARGGLGVHLTLDLAGQARFGPDVEWTSKVEYDVDPSRVSGFYEAVRTYWPGLPDGALRPGYAGVRSRIVGPGAPAADFSILGPRQHGVRGLVCLFGIESPGLTASLAIGEYVVKMLDEQK